MVMASSDLKRDGDDVSESSSFLTTGPDSSGVSVRQYPSSRSTPVTSPRSSTTSYSSQSTLFSEPASSDTKIEGWREKKDPVAQRYTRCIVRNTQRTTTVRTVLLRTRSGSTVPSAICLPSSRSPSSSAVSPRAALPTRRRNPTGHNHPYQITMQNPNNIYTCHPPRGPDLPKISHPIPDIIVTDYSLLLSAASRYASSPRCLARTQPYHNIVDPRFLGRYSASEGVNMPMYRSIDYEVADVDMFAELGGQDSVVVVGCKRLVQRRVVARGCPSCACSCGGRSVAMSWCWDLSEDEEGEVPVSGERSCRLRRVRVTDRIEEARRMRVRIEQRRPAREANTKAKKEEPNATQHENKVGVKQGLGRIKTIRRIKSKFIEVGCTPGNDVTADSVAGTSTNDREVLANTPVAESKGGQDRKILSSKGKKNAKKSWMQRLLHV